MTLGDEWTARLRGLFSTLVKIAYPDKSAPVLQDDTDIPWAEKNNISEAMTLGYLLFEDPAFGYFASNQVDARMYWFLNQSQLELLENIKGEKPSYGSLAFTDTDYYIMREGWDPNDNMLIISAGLDAEKPDHQHGDMLGIQAMANGHAILPNYQVRYSLTDFDLFKNSMVKNVALVDDELQGKKWTSNKGGSGFGKFKSLPNPEVLAWSTQDDFDVFVGSHDGFENVGVAYSRQVIFVKGDFWIVKDNFSSDVPHEYKQVWQGHYTSENGSDLLRATAPDASGHDILQLIPSDTVVNSGARGKEWSIVSKKNQKEFSFLTVIYPYKGYDNRIDETKGELSLYGWHMNKTDWTTKGEAPISLTQTNRSYFFGVEEVSRKNLNIQFSSKTDIFIKQEANELHISLLGPEKSILTFSNKGGVPTQKELSPGELWKMTFSDE